MKKLLLLALIVCLLVAVSAEVFAIDKVDAVVGGYAFMRPGDEGRFSWSFSFDAPLGINNKSMDIQEWPDGTADTTYVITYELIFRGAILHSAFDGFDTPEIEAAYMTTIHRKTLGVTTWFVDLGSSVWEFGDTEGGNETLVGWYLGTGINLISADIELMLGGHLIPIKDEPDMYIFGLQLGVEF